MRDELLRIHHTRRAPPLWPAVLAVAALAIGAVGIGAAPLGPFATHMAAHILLMNGVAPFLALAILRRRPELSQVFASGRILAAASVAQLAALWGWHAPQALEAAVGQAWLHAAMQLSLFVAAGLFWLAVLSDRSAMRWRGLFALLLTGKLFCLLGVLLVFAPRLVYPGLDAAHGHAAMGTAGALSDQQLAGLLMVVACPLSYVLAGVVITAGALRSLAESGGPLRRLAGST